MNAPADVVILVPVLGRPHRVRPLVESIDAATVRCDILFLATAGDPAEIAAIEALQHPRVRCELLAPNRRGDYAKKINHGYRVTDNPYLFLGADDLHFHPGWLEAALAAMTADGIGVVGTQDLANRRVLRGQHATHSLVDRRYIDALGTIDEPGLVLHEGYWHEFVDDEFVETAKTRHAFAFAHDSIVEHLHPTVGKARPDKLYRQEPQRMQAGRILYHQRKHLWS